MYSIELPPSNGCPPMRRLGYSRVSSQEQARDSNAHKQQTQRLLDAGATEILEEILSGRKDDRPQLERVLELIRTNQIDEFIVTRIDRMGRSVGKLHEIILLCLEKNVNLRILDQNLNLRTPEGKLMAALLSGVAEWEVNLLSQRIRHGLNYRMDQKKAPGSYPFGFQVIEGQYLPDDRPFLCLLSDRPNNYGQLAKEPDWSILPSLTRHQIGQDAVEMVFAERRSSRTLKVLYDKYGVSKTSAKKNGTDGILNWSRSSFRNWLKNPVLRGHTLYRGRIVVGSKGKVIKNPDGPTVIRDTHPEHRLLTENQFAEIELILESNRRIGTIEFAKPAAEVNDYLPYSYQVGSVFCAECGSRCISKHGGSVQRYCYYACRHAGVGCSSHKSIRKDLIEDALIQELVKRSMTVGQEPEQPDEIAPQKTCRLKELQEQLDKLEKVPGFLEGVEQEKIKIQQQIEEILNPPPLNQSIGRSAREILAAGSNLADWYTLSNREKVEVYSKLLNKVLIRKGQVELVLLKI